MNETQDTPQAATQPPTQSGAPVQVPTLPYTFKAHLGEYRKRLGAGRILLALGLTSIFAFRFGVLVWILSVIGIAAVIWGVMYLLSTRTITLSSDSIVYRNGFGKQRTIRLSEIEGVKAFLGYIEASFGIAPRIVVGVKGDAAPLILSALYWKPDDLDIVLAYATEKSLETISYPDPVSYPAIAKEFPSYASYIERHTGLVAIIAVVAILIVVVAIALLITFN